MVFALAIETGLQLFDRRAGQDQRVGAKDVIDIGPDRRQRVDADDLDRSLPDAAVDRIALHDERAAAALALAALPGPSRARRVRKPSVRTYGSRWAPPHPTQN